MNEEQSFPTKVVDTTCHTPGCVNDGVTHRIAAPVNADGIFRVVCGTCSEAVTDIVEVPE